MDYEYEYGRYKKKVEDQQKQIAELQEQIEGMQQVLQANNAIIVAILMDTESDRWSPLIVSKAAINMALKDGYAVGSEHDAESERYKLWYIEPKSE